MIRNSSELQKKSNVGMNVKGKILFSRIKHLGHLNRQWRQFYGAYKYIFQTFFQILNEIFEKNSNNLLVFRLGRNH